MEENEILEEVVLPIKSKKKATSKTKKCNVLKLIPNKDKAIIDFNGFGLMIDLEEATEEVKIKYSGEIGKDNFKYTVVK